MNNVRKDCVNNRVYESFSARLRKPLSGSLSLKCEEQLREIESLRRKLTERDRQAENLRRQLNEKELQLTNLRADKEKARVKLEKQLRDPGT